VVAGPGVELAEPPVGAGAAGWPSRDAQTPRHSIWPPGDPGGRGAPHPPRYGPAGRPRRAQPTGERRHRGVACQGLEVVGKVLHCGGERQSIELSQAASADRRAKPEKTQLPETVPWRHATLVLFEGVVPRLGSPPQVIQGQPCPFGGECALTPEKLIALVEPVQGVNGAVVRRELQFGELWRRRFVDSGHSCPTSVGGRQRRGEERRHEATAMEEGNVHPTVEDLRSRDPARVPCWRLTSDVVAGAAGCWSPCRPAPRNQRSRRAAGMAMEETEFARSATPRKSSSSCPGKRSQQQEAR
jgi:hypothetical protein